MIIFGTNFERFANFFVQNSLKFVYWEKKTNRVNAFVLKG